MNIIRHRIIDSTNREAVRLIAEGQLDDGVIVAGCQTAGQGRYDRRWESAPKLGLWFSVIRTLRVDIANLPQATLVAAVAIIEGIEAVTGLPTEVKWPNDLMVGDRKMCGILVENPMGYAADAHTLIFGIGVNIAHRKSDFPPALADKATSIEMELGKEVDMESIMQAIVWRLDAWLNIWTTLGFAPIREVWLARNCTIGRRMALSDPALSEAGQAIDLSSSGSLIMRMDSGSIQNIEAGELVFCASH